MATAAESQSPLPPITPDSIVMSGATFLAAFASPDESPRNAARLYFLGVMDVTEGRHWCDYKTVKTVTAREHVYLYLKKLPPQRLSGRASLLIAEALEKSFPCEKGSK
jgi:hypothetical protein